MAMATSDLNVVVRWKVETKILRTTLWWNNIENSGLSLDSSVSLRLKYSVLHTRGKSVGGIKFEDEGIFRTK